MDQTLVIFLISLVAGAFGVLLGLGGGILLIPMLSLGLGTDLPYAIGASLISVIASSSASTLSHLRTDLINIRLGVFIEPSTVLGAILGALLLSYFSPSLLYILFALAVVIAAISLFIKKEIPNATTDSDQWAKKLRLNTTQYNVNHTLLGYVLSFFAGILSGLLGLGGGIIVVPLFHVLMGIPMRVATSTSSFGIGVTAASSASIYYFKGLIDPLIAVPSALGIIIGAIIGARILRIISTRSLKWLFTLVLLYTAYKMFMKGMVS